MGGQKADGQDSRCVMWPVRWPHNDDDVCKLCTCVCMYRFAEPNLLSQTTHSISRKGVKKRDLSDVELRDILSDVLPHIRTDHVLPKDSEVLTNAIKRGLVSVPPSHMIGSDTVAVGGQSSASAWVRTRNMALFIKPRLFVPYFDEVKVGIVLIHSFFCPYFCPIC